jgi:hypothetical protein
VLQNVIQNENINWIIDFLSKYNLKSKTLIINTSIIPLSKARNIGLKKVFGNIICFPDDDCWYECNFFESVIQLFNKNFDTDVLCFNVYDPHKKLHYGKGRNISKEIVRINSLNSFKFPISVGIFIKPKSLSHIVFDENIGLGTIIGSGEETDLIHKLLSIKYHIKFYSKINVYHPVNNEYNFDRIKMYSRGYGYTVATCLKTHRLYLLLYPFTLFIFKHLIAVIIYFSLLNRVKVLKYYYRFSYAIIGFLKALYS